MHERYGYLHDGDSMGLAFYINDEGASVDMQYDATEAFNHIPDVAAYYLHDWETDESQPLNLPEGVHGMIIVFTEMFTQWESKHRAAVIAAWDDVCEKVEKEVAEEIADANRETEETAS